MTLKMVTRDAAGMNTLITAWQKSRSIAAEGGYLDLMDRHDGLPGLDWAIGDERTLDMLLAYADGSRPLDDNNWMNLCWLVNMSGSWVASLAFQGCEMPVYDITEQLAWDREEVEHGRVAYQAGLDTGLNSGYRMGASMRGGEKTP